MKHCMGKVVRTLIYSLTGMLLLASCTQGTGSEAFRAPEILSAEAQQAWKAATLRCTLSDGRADRCGFLFENATGEWQTLPTSLQDCHFETTVEGLAPGRTYRFLAFAEAGESRVETDTLRFTTRGALTTDPIDVEDPVVADWLLSRFDSDGDGHISFAEAALIRVISIAPTNQYNLRSLQGIEYMPNLEEVHCWADYNDATQSPAGTLCFVDFSHNPKLKSFALSHNGALGKLVPTLDLSSCPALRFVNVSDCGLREIIVSGCPELEQLTFYSNELTSVDVRSCPRLTILSIADNRLHEIDVRANAELEELAFNGNPVTAIDISQNPKLRSIYCWSCALEELDVSANPALQTLICYGNPLRTLYVAEGQTIPFITVDRRDDHIPPETEIVIKH